MAEPPQLAFRTLKGVGLLNADPVYESPSAFTRPEGNFRCNAYSPDGRYFAWASPESVSVVDASVGHEVTTINIPSVYELGFSPLGSFLITWQRPSKDEKGDAAKNLKVWRIRDETVGEDGRRAVLGEFVQKSQTGWNLQYTPDEQFCARTVTNEVQFYKSDDLGTVWNKLRVEGVAEFAMSPGADPAVAVFVPERKGQPASVKVFKVPQFDVPVSQKTFFKCDKVQLKWNKHGTAILVLAQTEVDKSNRSYDVGETNMFILSTNGQFDARIELDKEGPIFDVAWNPNCKDFGVVYGYMPAKTTIFNLKGNAIHSFGLAMRNTIRFSPHGRFVLVAGFGNLVGESDIYDLEKDYAKVSNIKASNSSICEWSPDGKHLLTATTSQRLKVDNGIRIWHVGGSLMYNEDMVELYDVLWRPQPLDKHPLPADPLNPVPQPHESAMKYLATVKTPSKPAGAYRPPGARGASTPFSFKREDQGGAAFTANGAAPPTNSGMGIAGINFSGRAPKRREVPGAETVEEKLPPGAAPGGGVSLTIENGDDSGLSKAALKNRKKREARKQAKEAEGKGSDDKKPDGEPDAQVAAPDRSRTPAAKSSQHLEVRSSQRPQSENRNRDRDRSRQRKAKPGNGSANHTRTGTSPSPAPRQRSQHRPPRNRSPQKQQQQHSSQSQSASSSSQHLPTQRQKGAPPIPPPPPPAPALATPDPLSASTPPPPTPPERGDLASPEPDTPLDGAGPQTPRDKKVRALNKKLRAIEELKMRQAGGEKLELSQVSKIKTEEAVKRELTEMVGEG